MNETIRPVSKEDLPELKNVIESSELFPSEFLDSMIADFLLNPASEDIWITKTEDDIPVAFGYCAP